MEKGENISREDLNAVESPPLTDALLKQMRPVAETHPEIPPKVRGPQKASTKKSTTIRLNAEVIDFFKSQGKGWRTRINDVLQEYVDSAR